MENNEKRYEQGELFGEPLDLNKERERLEAERQAVARFYKLQDGEMATLKFTGKVYRAENAFGNETVYFELTDENERGQHKLFSTGAKSSIVPKLFDLILGGQLEVTLMRAGSGTQTQYTVVKQKK